MAKGFKDNQIPILNAIKLKGMEEKNINLVK